MTTNIARKLLAAILCGGMLAAAGAADARDRDWDDRNDGWHKHKHYHKHGHGWDKRTVYRERVIIRERPRHYSAPVIHHHYYEPPPRAYSYSRSPAVVIGVDIPPIVIPIR